MKLCIPKLFSYLQEAVTHWWEKIKDEHVIDEAEWTNERQPS